MHVGRNYRRFLPPALAGNMYQPGHGVPFAMHFIVNFPWSTTRIGVGPTQSTQQRVILNQGFVEWSWADSSGVFDFVFHFQQLLIPGSPDLKWDLAINDTFGGIGVWEWVGRQPEYSYTSTILGWPPSTTKFVSGFFYDNPLFLRTAPVTYHEEP